MALTGVQSPLPALSAPYTRSHDHTGTNPAGGARHPPDTRKAAARLQATAASRFARVRLRVSISPARGAQLYPGRVERVSFLRVAVLPQLQLASAGVDLDFDPLSGGAGEVRRSPGTAAGCCAAQSACARDRARGGAHKTTASMAMAAATSQWSSESPRGRPQPPGPNGPAKPTKECLQCGRALLEAAECTGLIWRRNQPAANTQICGFVRVRRQQPSHGSVF